MSKYQGEITLEIDGVDIQVRGTWGVFAKVFDNTGQGPTALARRFISHDYSVNELGYLIYFGVKAAEQQDVGLETLTYKKLTDQLEGMNKQYLAAKCAELCQLFIFGVNSIEDTVDDEPLDSDNEKKT